MEDKNKDPGPKNLRELSLTDHLAIDRTRLANQRTMLAYIRLGLYLFLFAVSILKIELLEDLRSIVAALCVLGVVAIGIGMIQYLRIGKKLNQQADGYK